eukprot:SAG31_NODE_3705_length_3973_cov_2.463345_5_plen_151_part_01
MYRHGHKFDHAVVELAVRFRIHRPTVAAPKPDLTTLNHPERGGDEEVKAAFDEAVTKSLNSGSSGSSSDNSDNGSDGEAEANSLSSLKQNTPTREPDPPPPADAPRAERILMRCFGGGWGAPQNLPRAPSTIRMVVAAIASGNTMLVGKSC